MPAYTAIPEASPIDLMRSPQRILNHLDLLKKKIAIGKKYGLVPSDHVANAAVQANLGVIAAVLEGSCSFEAARLAILGNLNDVGHRYQADEFEQDLWQAFQVGLLEYHITDCCDLACPHCFYGSTGKGATIPFSEFSKLRLIQPKAMIITGGGEPTIYHSGKNKFNEAVQEICVNVPGVQLGLQTNGTVVPRGDWQKSFLYSRASVDADNQQTYVNIKSKPYLDKVIRNLVMIARTNIPFVGVGFLFEKQNIDQIPSFIRMFHSLIKTEAPQALAKFTIQFRPLGPEVDILKGVRDGSTAYPPGASPTQIENLRKEVSLLRAESQELADFVDRNTNLDATWPGNSGHPLVEFKHCYVALAYRMIRASGNNFPCFILVRHERMCLGNFFGKDPSTDQAAYLAIALCGYHFFNCRTEYCNACFCRQSKVNRTAENAIENGTEAPAREMGTIYFF